MGNLSAESAAPALSCTLLCAHVFHPPLPAEMAETQPPAEKQPRAPPAAMQWTDLRRVLFDAYCDISTADIAIQRAMGTIKELLDVVQEKVSPL